MSEQRRYAAVVLAGGAGRRLGGVSKPALPVGGRSMLDRVLDAVAGAVPRIVVGPPELALPDGVARTREQPPGGGPVAAAAAGMALLPGPTRLVALLASDLPLLTPAALEVLHAALAGDDAEGPERAESPEGAEGPEGSVYVDDSGREQWLCGMWRTDALRARIDAVPGGPAGASLRAVLGRASVVRCRVAPAGAAPPPYWDCDTGADLQRARSWA